MISKLVFNGMSMKVKEVTLEGSEGIKEGQGAITEEGEGIIEEEGTIEGGEEITEEGEEGGRIQVVIIETRRLLAHSHHRILNLTIKKKVEEAKPPIIIHTETKMQRMIVKAMKILIKILKNKQ